MRRTFIQERLPYFTLLSKWYLVKLGKLDDEKNEYMYTRRPRTEIRYIIAENPGWGLKDIIDGIKPNHDWLSRSVCTIE